MTKANGTVTNAPGPKAVLRGSRKAAGEQPNITPPNRA